jgi:hypothetical protein
VTGGLPLGPGSGQVGAGGGRAGSSSGVRGSSVSASVAQVLAVDGSVAGAGFVLGPVVQTLVGAVLDRGHDLAVGCAVGAELVGDDHPRHRPGIFEEPAEESPVCRGSSLAVATATGAPDRWSPPRQVGEVLKDRPVTLVPLSSACPARSGHGGCQPRSSPRWSCWRCAHTRSCCRSRSRRSSSTRASYQKTPA